MKRFLVIGLALMLICSFALAKNDVPAKPRVQPMALQGELNAPDYGRYVECELFHYDTLSGWFHNAGWYWTGEIMKNYFDPADCGSYVPPNPYPFQIDSVWIPIYFVPGLPAGIYTFAVDIECADLTGENPYQCAYYPGLEVCTATFQVYYDGLGYYLFEDLIPLSCCMDQPFFLSLHFLDAPDPYLLPGLVFDTSYVETCIQWYN
ncbi:hypothetical protein AMJ86_02865, partial [bacterium SM23_57]